MSIDKDKLNALADRVLNERRFCVDEHHRELAEGVQALLAEVGFLLESRAEARGDRSNIGDRYDAAIIERDQLKAENEALRKDAERYRAIRDDIPNVELGRAILDVQSADEYDAAVDAAMAKEASHG